MAKIIAFPLLVLLLAGGTVYAHAASNPSAT